MRIDLRRPVWLQTAVFLGTACLAAQVPAPRQTPAPLESLPDLARLAPVEVPRLNPLAVPLDTPPRLVERPPLADLETKEPLFVAVRLEESGRAVEAVAVEPPLKVLGTAVPLLVPRWSFQPARKAGKPVKTWATLGLDLLVELEEGKFVEFTVRPLEKEDPLPAVARENTGDRWLARYPREVSPAEPDVVSVEELDGPPVPDRIPWKVESAKLSSRLRALLQIGEDGTVRKLVPVGADDEGLVVKWVRRGAAGWRFSPARLSGKPVGCWALLDTTVEYTLNTAKEKGKRSVKKNLRGAPAS